MVCIAGVFMSRQWVSDKNRKWVMVCDTERCTTQSDIRRHESELPLEEFALAGWYIGHGYGDKCPKCVEVAGGISELMKRSEGATRPHRVMLEALIARSHSEVTS